MPSSRHYSRNYVLSIVTAMVLCLVALSSGCNSYSEKQNDRPNTSAGTQAAVKQHHDHPNTAKGTGAAVKEIVEVVEKSLADLPPPPSAPAVCDEELTKVRETWKSAPGTPDAAKANAALLRCTAKATNETKCKGKPQPCGVAYYSSPFKPSEPGQPAPEPSESIAVDVSASDQIAAACREITGAAGAGSSTSAGAENATGVILGSVIGRYSCGAWFKAAAKDDPILLITPVFVPTIQLLRDLKTYTSGAMDTTPEAVLANSVKRTDAAVIAVPLAGTLVPVGVLPIVRAGSTPGQVLDEAHKTMQQRVNLIAKTIGDDCKMLGICH